MTARLPGWTRSDRTDRPLFVGRLRKSWFKAAQITPEREPAALLFFAEGLLLFCQILRSFWEGFRSVSGVYCCWAGDILREARNRRGGLGDKLWGFPEGKIVGQKAGA